MSKDVDREYLMAQALQYRDAAERGQALPEAWGSLNRGFGNSGFRVT